MLEKYNVLLWDFDGVLMDSMPIRDRGFIEVLKGYPDGQVDQLMSFHRKNGGLSRFVKFRYFFEEVREESVSEERILELTNSFSKIMLSLLINEKLLISDSINYVKRNSNKYEMHIVSGSAQKELRIICDALNLSQYFKSINGSPIPKVQLVSSVLEHNNYQKKSVVLIGDSINDFEAAQENGISFIGYNNKSLLDVSSFYINSFGEYE